MTMRACHFTAAPRHAARLQHHIIRSFIRHAISPSACRVAKSREDARKIRKDVILLCTYARRQDEQYAHREEITYRVYAIFHEPFIISMRARENMRHAPDDAPRRDGTTCPTFTKT